jgi:HK97 gp10 family phage protein
VAKVGTNVEYARHLEYGTVKMRPRPFLRPALSSLKGARLA